MDARLKKTLSANGGFSKIYAAIDTYDMAKVVRTTMRALNLTNFQKVNVDSAKSRAQSATFRKQGNDNYKAGRNRLAIELYNKALAFAPLFSEEMILAYGNRSAVFFSIKYFTGCVNDINTCLVIGCSEDLARKLRIRRDEATPYVMIELAVKSIGNSEFVNSYLQFNFKRNSDVPCASADVAFMTRDGAKRATAGSDIIPGTVIAEERAFVSCPLEDIYLSCYYCNRADLCLYPCDGCTLALFCSNDCRDRCMKEYHCIECKVLQFLESMYDGLTCRLATRATIKLSLKMVWDDFITASKNIGASRMKTSTVRQIFNSEEPLSILNYNDDKLFMEGKMFNGSVICAYILQCLTSMQPKYFPEGEGY